MNPITFSELTLFAQELQRFLSPIVLQETAKQVGFVQRSSKYQANGLIALCVWLCQEVASTSLTHLCSRLEASTGVLISPEGLNQRFNPAAVAFLREVFTSLLTQKLCFNQSLSSGMISAFKRIRILDETLEISKAYIGQNQKLPARVIIHRLTNDQTQTRLKNQALREKKKGIVMKDKSKHLMGMNVYITNTSPEEVPTDYVHSLYSLRWQIEILFKTWKSFFEIDECKTIKKERLECHLYGQLIGILLCSSTMFQMRQLLLKKKKKELSEYKAIYMIKDYFPLLFQAMAVGTDELLKILHRLYHLLKKNGRKCHRYKKMTVFDILGVVYQTTVKDRQAA